MIKTPTMFMGGEKDFNVTVVGGEQMYQALKSVGTAAELVVYPGAGMNLKFVYGYQTEIDTPVRIEGQFPSKYPKYSIHFGF